MWGEVPVGILGSAGKSTPNGGANSVMSYIPPADNPDSGWVTERRPTSRRDVAQQRENSQAMKRLAEQYSAVHGDEVPNPGLFARLMARVRNRRPTDDQLGL